MRSFFEPKSIAVAGVSTDQNKMGSIIFANMLVNRREGRLRASVYALNPAHDHIGDQPSYPSIDALPETPELLVVAVPESSTLGLIKSAAKSGVKASVIVTSGYSEVGRGDVEKKIGHVAAKHGMRILGPNTIGVVDTRSGVDTLFLRPTKTLPDGNQVVSMLKPLAGEIAIITQSGHLGQSISEELAANGVGIRALVGTGNQLDVSVEDVIEYFADDPHTKVVVVYLEGVRDGRRFMCVASYAAKKKPLVVLKVGKTGVGARAALTHTASLVGDHEVYRAAFWQSGVVEANTFEELVDHSISFSMFPRAAGKRLAIVTNAGGIGAIAADEAGELGLQLNRLGAKAQRKLRAEFEGAGFISNVSLANPVDLTASATTEEFVRATEAILALPEYDLALVMPTHQTPAIGHDIASRLGDVVAKTKKPVSMCVVGNTEFSRRIHKEFMSRGIPSFPTPERAVRALAAAVTYMELKKEATEQRAPPQRAPHRFSRKRGPIPSEEVSALLSSCGIVEPKSVVIGSSKDLGRLKGFGFPVACKLLSEGLFHKTDVGGVILGVADEAQAGLVFSRLGKLAGKKGVPFDGMLVQQMVSGGVELILGGTRDPTFGPVVILGLGGTYTELVRDYSLAIAPVTSDEVRVMVAQTKLGRALEGYRGGPKVKAGRLRKIVSDFSRIMVENPSIQQMEVNPLIATRDEIMSVDARATLAEAHP